MIRSIVLTGDKPSDEIFGIITFIKDIPVIPIIIGKFFVPINLSPMPLYDNTSIILGTILSIILIIPIVKSIKKKKWIVLIGILWFLILIIPSLFFRVPNAEYIMVYAEHRMYLPIIGLLLIIAYWFNDYKIKFNTSKLGILFIPILFIFTYITYTHTDSYKNSIIFYSSVIDVSHNNMFAYTSRGVEYYKNNKTQNALSDFNKAIEIFPYSYAYLYRGIIETKMQNYYAAEKDYTDAIALDPLSETACINRASIREHLKNYEGALQDLQNAANLDRNNFKIFYNAGNIYMAVKEYKTAINNFSIALDLKPDFTDALNNRVIARYNIKDYTGIIEDCNKLVKFNYDLENTYNNMGIAYLNLAKYDEAIECFNKTININKNFSTAYYNRGIAEQKKNKIIDAKNDWKEALKLGYAPAKEMLDKYCK
jgi:tetratricopeptide (TPR) repeat protein